MSTNTVTYACSVQARVSSEGSSQRWFFSVLALLFAGSTALTIGWCGSMSGMGGMPMPGGWTMSMMWMRMPGQTWPGTMASFVGMWVTMMVAMMLPSLAPTLLRFRRTITTVGGTTGQNWLSVLFALGYFLVWAAVGIIVFPLGVKLSGFEMQLPELARGVPLAAGLVVLAAGAFQFTGVKRRLLTCCRETPGVQVAADGRSALRGGLQLGLHCTYACAGLTAILLVMGVMDLRVMAGVTAAITTERLAPAGERIARGIGVIIAVAGLCLIARTA